MAKTNVIIVAAGNGSRYGGELPKQFTELCGVPVLVRNIANFANTVPDARITVVLNPEYSELWGKMARSFLPDVPHAVVAGGATRWESVKNAIESLGEEPASSVVLIHDAARPFTPGKVITSCINAARNTDGAIPVVAVTDSLRMTDEWDTGSQPVDRTRFRAVQTPQASTLWRLREAYSLPYEDTFTDDASVLAAAGFTNVILTEGAPENIKITNPIDRLLAEAIIKDRQTKGQE